MQNLPSPSPSPSAHVQIKADAITRVGSRGSGSGVYAGQQRLEKVGMSGWEEEGDERDIRKKQVWLLGINCVFMELVLILGFRSLRGDISFGGDFYWPFRSLNYHKHSITSSRLYYWTETFSVLSGSHTNLSVSFMETSAPLHSTSIPRLSALNLATMIFLGHSL